MTGYIFDHRKELESDVWLLPPMYHRVWQWIKYMVNHSEAKIPNKDGTFTVLMPGQHATSLRHIAKGVGYYEGLKWKEPNPKTIKTILDWLEKQGMITVKGNTLGTVVTVVNWQLYQKEIVKGNSERITDKHLLDTNKKKQEELKNDEEEKKKPKELKTFLPDSIEYRASEYLWGKILANNPDAKKPNIQSWSREMDLIMRVDKRSQSDLGKVIDFCQSDPFWKSNILSPKKLREKYDQLKSKMVNNNKTPTKGSMDELTQIVNSDHVQKFLRGDK